MNKKILVTIFILIAGGIFSFIYADSAGAAKAKQKNTVVPATVVKATSVPEAVVEDKEAPKLYVDASSWDFGRIMQGDKVSHIYRVENQGQNDLIIHNVRTTCGCTVAQISTNTLASGGKSEIEVTFDSKNYKDYIERTLFIESNDPKTPSQRIVVHGFVESAFIDVTLMINSRKYMPGKTADTQRLMIKNTGPEDIVISKVRSSTSKYKVILTSDTIPKNDYSFATVMFNTEKNKQLKKKVPNVKKDYIYMEIAIPVEEIQ